MNTAQLEQYRDLLARMSKARTADAATTDALVLAVADLVEEVERLQAQLERVPEYATYYRERNEWETEFPLSFAEWLDAEQDAANAAAELRAPTYNGGCW
mgnify:FL=1